MTSPFERTIMYEGLTVVLSQRHQDYSTSELHIPGISFAFNSATIFIDLMAKIGWACDRKSVNADIVARRKLRCGDGNSFVDSFRPSKWEGREGGEEAEERVREIQG